MKNQVMRLVYLLFFFVVLVATILGSSGPASASTQTLSSLSNGDTVYFAGYGWTVLDHSTGYLLMNTDYTGGVFDTAGSNSFRFKH